jgi:hypothetical protein
VIDILRRRLSCQGGQSEAVNVPSDKIIRTF